MVYAGDGEVSVISRLINYTRTYTSRARMDVFAPTCRLALGESLQRSRNVTSGTPRYRFACI